MAFIGIVAEYAPFHKGHAYQLAEAKRLSGAGVIVVMSGCFLQRGEAAPVSPFIRAQAAVDCGADIVVQLPVWGSLAPARDFARCAIGLLRLLGAEGISFGAEHADREKLLRTASLLREEPAALAGGIRQGLERGLSHPTAIQRAMEDYCPALADILRRSNDILAVEYLRAMGEMGWKGSLFPVERLDNAHADTVLPKTGYASASALRRAMERGEDISPYLPEKAALQAGKILLPADPVLILRERYIEKTPLPGDGGEGLENYLAKAVLREATLSGILEAAATRRYSEARLRRCIWQVLLGMTPADRALFREQRPVYGRLLAASPEGMEHFASLPEAVRACIAVKPAAFAPAEAAARGWALDNRAWGLYGVLTGRQLDWHFRERLYVSGR